MHRYDAGNSSYNPDTYGPKGEPEIEWEFDLTARSLENPLTSFVVVDGSVFVASGRPDDTLYSLNAVNGGTVWSYDDFSVMRALADPLAYKHGRVYAVDGSLWSFDAWGGTKNWREWMGGGAHQGPKYADGRVYVNGGSHIYCFNTDGTVEWRSEVDSARPIAVDGGRVVVCSLGEGTEVLDAEDGSVVWSVDFERTHPVAQDGVAFVSDRSELFAFDIDDGTELWSHDWGGDVKVLTEDRVYNRHVVLDVESGEEVWRIDQVDALPQRWEGTLADCVLYMWDSEELYAYDTEELELLWSVELNFRLRDRTQPVVAEGRVYIESGTRLYCIGEST